MPRGSESLLLPPLLAKHLSILLLRNTCSVFRERLSWLNSFTHLSFASFHSIHLLQIARQTAKKGLLIPPCGGTKYSGVYVNWPGWLVMQILSYFMKMKKISMVILLLAALIFCKISTIHTFKPSSIRQISSSVDKHRIPMHTRQCVPGCVTCT